MTENFILQEFLPDISVCDRLIGYFESHPDKKQGMNAYKVDDNIKKSTDVWVTDQYNPIVQDYLAQLKQVCDKYIEKYHWVNEYSAWGITQPFNIQHYKPNEGFYAWHTERSDTRPDISSRHLVFMTYLNDVDDAGETEFYYQKLKIKPRKGLTVMWGTDWTFTHRGIPSPSQDKYIVTGWYNFLD